MPPRKKQGFFSRITERFFPTERRSGKEEARRREQIERESSRPSRRTRYRDIDEDPFYKTYRDFAYKGDRVRPGYLEHRDIAETYENALDMDYDRRLRFWRDYTYYMVGDRYKGHLRKDPQNPFWQRSGISPDAFDWDAWRSAMGDSPRKK